MTARPDTTALLTTEDVADQLGVSVRTLQRLLKRYDIRHDRVTSGQARHKLYTASTVTYLRQQRGAAPDATDDAPSDSQHDTTDDLATTAGHGAAALLSLVEEMAAMREERDTLRHERDALLERALVAEWEAARWRPLTPVPDPPPAPRRRWWWW